MSEQKKKIRYSGAFEEFINLLINLVGVFIPILPRRGHHLVKTWAALYYRHSCVGIGLEWVSLAIRDGLLGGENCR